MRDSRCFCVSEQVIVVVSVRAILITSVSARRLLYEVRSYFCARMQVILTVSAFCVRAGDSRCSLILCEQVIASCSFCVRQSDSHCFLCVHTGDSCRFCAVRAQVILVDSICGHVCDSHCFCWRAQVTLVASV